MTYQAVIIIGAPRSGTNMLRDVLCRLPGFGTWPCDEINYIWRHGNASWPSDEFPKELATTEVSDYLQRCFAKRARIGSLTHVVEKTCANSLRVSFVDRALPNARYIFIYRDPIDAVASAARQWQAGLNIRYTLAKARFVPLSDIPYYGYRFLLNRLHKLLSRDHRLASWGPRFEQMAELQREYTLAELCAAQWNACVTRAARAFLQMPQETVHAVSYEEFVASPSTGIEAICNFLRVPSNKPILEQAIASVSRNSIGKGHRSINTSMKKGVDFLVAPGKSAVEAFIGDARTTAANHQLVAD